MSWPWKLVVTMRRKLGEIYMKRIQLLKTPLLSIYVNHIRLPDEDPWLHTHPWRKSWSLKLGRGWYEEEVPDRLWDTIGWTIRRRVYRPWRTRQRPERLSRVPDQHRIVQVSPGGCWTLFIGWRSDQPWGFVDPWTDEIASWQERAIMCGMPESAFSGGQNGGLK